MQFSLGLISVLVLLAVVITVVIRPDIFLSTLRGGGEKKPVRRNVVTDKEFQTRLSAGQADKKENENG